MSMISKDKHTSTLHDSRFTPHRKVAVIGAGYWGKNLVRNFYQLGVLKTICDGAQSICGEMIKTYPDVAVTDDINSVLNDADIEAVVIATPAVLHSEIAEKALLALEIAEFATLESQNEVKNYAVAIAEKFKENSEIVDAQIQKFAKDSIRACLAKIINLVEKL